MMKRLVLLLSTLMTMASVFGQSYNFLGSYTSDGTPEYLVGRDEVSYETLQKIDDALPEGYPVPKYNPQYISSGYDTDILLEKDADVWVTFVAEGAGYRNVLGFYTYDIENPPAEKPGPEDITIVFPNVSARGSGGGLQAGDKVSIGRFNAGTGIGWVLLANGWRGSVTPGHWQLYSNPDYNPEADENLRFHNVLLNDTDSERIILGFEDIRRDYGSCDNDFNDALFYITANPYEAIRTSNFNDIEEHYDVSSGNDGGLESNGDLASLIAKRNFDRKKLGTAKNTRNKQRKYSKSTYKSRSGKSGRLDGYFPESGMFGTETTYVSSPEDLLNITNADKVFSIDYYQGSERVTAALATETKNGVYNHTKTICDRLNDSKLRDVRTVKLQGHELVYSKLERSGGAVEYALVFSVREEGNQRKLYSLWNIGEYPSGDYMNFQVWGNSMGQVSTVVNNILETLDGEKPLVSHKAENILPTVFIRNGYYQAGKLHLNVINKVGASWMQFDGNYKRTEQSTEENMTTILPLNGDWEEEVIVDTGFLFDIGLSVIAENSYQHDAMYLADGPWGVDMNDAVDSVDSFTINEHEQKNTRIGIHEVARGISASGQVKETINVFRNVLGGERQLPTEDFNYLEFSIQNSRTIEVSLVTDQTTDWNDRLRLSLDPNEMETVHSLSFADFKDRSGSSVAFSKLKSIVFSVQGDYKTYKPFSLKINQMTLSADAYTAPLEEVATIAEAVPQPDFVMNYPNPVEQYTVITFPLATDRVEVSITAMTGKLVYLEDKATAANQHSVGLQLGGMAPGLYAYVVRDMKNNKVYRGKLIKK